MVLKQPTVYEIRANVYMINCYGLSCAFLVVGTEAALLIDSGAGNVDLRPIIAKFTDLPVSVVLTHGHSDHSGASRMFGKVYVPEGDVPIYKALDREYMQYILCKLIDDLDSQKLGVVNLFQPPRELIGWDGPDPEIVPISDGYRFDLGGRTVTAYACPGHTMGHMVFVDDVSRVAFVGDTISRYTGIRELSVERALQGFENVASHGDSFDKLVYAHACWLCDEGVVLEDKQQLTDSITACRGILDGSLERFLENPMNPFYTYQRTYVKVNGIRLFFNPDNLYISQEDPADLQRS